MSRSAVFLFLGLAAASTAVTSTSLDYCVIGAGPGGIQLGHYFLRAGRNYAIFERAEAAGSFYEDFP
eukprot:gene10068-4480_t